MTSTSNDLIVLESILSKRRQTLGDDLRDDDAFELFTFEQILKNYDLSYEELLNGKVGSGNDGGIDGFFTFIENELADSDFDLESVQRKPKLDVFLIQSKQTPSFKETPITRLIATSEAIFDLSKSADDLEHSYNSLLIGQRKVFTRAYIALANRHPELTFHFIYACRGDTQILHQKIKELGETLKNIITKNFHGANCNIGFWGARELLEATRIEKSYTLQLRFVENYISQREDSYIVLSKLIDYFDFVTDESRALRRYIFEANVRDYQGDVEVNRDIRTSLESQDNLNLDFWYLNNGITILASQASVAGKVITLDDIQIVNGLQTTTTIFNYISDRKRNINREENRTILIRIIVAQDSEARDRIIKATNNQTAIPLASLRATDHIQRDIEDYFLQHGWFYDRRKNHYKNMGKPVTRIISIPYLAQSIMALLLGEPDNARARPSSLIKRSEDYNKVFSHDYGLNTLLSCATFMKQIEVALRTCENSPPSHLQFRFHIGHLCIMRKLQKIRYSADEFSGLQFESIDNDFIIQAFNDIISLTESYHSDERGNLDNISKSKNFVNYLIEYQEQLLDQVL